MRQEDVVSLILESTQKMFVDTTKLVRQDNECHANELLYASIIAHLAAEFMPIAHSNASEDPLGDNVVFVKCL